MALEFGLHLSMPLQNPVLQRDVVETRPGRRSGDSPGGEFERTAAPGAGPILGAVHRVAGEGCPEKTSRARGLRPAFCQSLREVRRPTPPSAPSVGWPNRSTGFGSSKLRSRRLPSLGRQIQFPIPNPVDAQKLFTRRGEIAASAGQRQHPHEEDSNTAIVEEGFHRSSAAKSLAVWQVQRWPERIDSL